MPGTFASVDELVGLAQAVVDAGGGLFEVVPQGETEGDADLILSEIELMGKVSEATGVPLSFLLVQSRLDPDLWRRQLELVEKVNANGADVTPQVAARPGGMLIGAASYHPLVRRPTYRRLEDSLPLDELLVELRKPEVKAAILAEENLPPDPHRQYESLADNAPYLWASVFPLGDPVDYERTPDQSIAGVAEATGRDPFEVFYDHLAAGDLLLGAFTNYAQGSEDHLAEMISDPNTVIGLSDGGAHVKMICDASAPTYLLTHWVRDRSRGERLPFELVVQKQAAGTAAAVGLDDRGTIAVGKKADVNVIDLEHLTLHPPRSIDDLPAGGRRILQDATGYKATIVSGVVTRRDDRDTGARPGRLVAFALASLLRLVGRALGGVERGGDPLVLGARPPFRALGIAFAALGVGELGARIGERGLEIGDVAVRRVEPLGRLGRGVGLLAHRLLGLLGPLLRSLELDACPAGRELVTWRRRVALRARSCGRRRGRAERRRRARTAWPVRAPG